MPRPLRTVKQRVDRYVQRLTALEYATTAAEVGDIWEAADRDREIGLLTDMQHRVIAARAEEVAAVLSVAEVAQEATHG